MFTVIDVKRFPNQHAKKKTVNISTRHKHARTPAHAHFYEYTLSFDAHIDKIEFL